MSLHIVSVPQYKRQNIKANSHHCEFFNIRDKIKYPQIRAILISGRLENKKQVRRNSNPLQYCLENSMDRGTGRATVHGVTKSQMQLNS